MANIKEAKEFVKRWRNRGDEKQDTHLFWIELLQKVFEDKDYDKHIQFEQVADKVEDGNNCKDIVINRYTDRSVLIEQKSSSLALDKPEPRFGTMVTPFDQAKDPYDDAELYDRHPLISHLQYTIQKKTNCMSASSIHERLSLLCS